MSIIALQRRLAEVGRIRLGTSVPATSRTGKAFRRPVKLGSFRFTSASRRVLDLVAEQYGGDVKPWAEAPTTSPQWEVETPATEIPVLVPPEHMSLSQHFEHWDAGRCIRRCDGAAQTTGEECVCDLENRPEGTCKPTTRLSLFLPQLLGSGLWRLDTRGYYAATELQGAFGLAQILAETTGRSVIPGMLSLQPREVKREERGKTVTHSFVVPVIEFDLGPALPSLVAGASRSELAALAPAAPPELPVAPAPSGLRPVPAAPAPSLAEELAEVDEDKPRSTRANAAEPIRPTGLRPRTAAQANGSAPADESDERPQVGISDGQRRAIVEAYAALGITDRSKRLRDTSVFCSRDIESTANLTTKESNALARELNRRIQAAKNPNAKPEPEFVPAPVAAANGTDPLAQFSGDPF